MALLVALLRLVLKPAMLQQNVLTENVAVQARVSGTTGRPKNVKTKMSASKINKDKSLTTAILKLLVKTHMVDLPVLVLLVWPETESRALRKKKKLTLLPIPMLDLLCLAKRHSQVTSIHKVEIIVRYFLFLKYNQLI